MPAAVIGTGLATASPAAAGGIIVIASPSFTNACANHGAHAKPRGHSSNGSGSAQGLLAQVPIVDAVNHCGGADVPPSWESDKTDQIFGLNHLLGG
ncbi:hypothetical protein ADL21_24895 [Streptomyces albus subsp. albus]|nr:hypothetical protein ADL21_24895 [Streptomyces albus subsp. albus]